MFFGFFCIWRQAYIGFEVGANPDNTSLDSHLEGEADDSSNLQQRLFTEAPSSLNKRHGGRLQGTKSRIKVQTGKPRTG